MDFQNTSRFSLDNLSGYVTCLEDDDDDNTRYLSVLSEDLSLDEMNVNLSNAQMNDDDGTLKFDSEDESKPFFFTIEGSDEIFGVQIARDEEGNLQKYQAQYTENLEGELVPIFETIQVLPVDENVESDVQRESDSNVQNMLGNNESHKVQHIVKLEEDPITEVPKGAMKRTKTGISDGLGDGSGHLAIHSYEGVRNPLSEDNIEENFEQLYDDETEKDDEVYHIVNDITDITENANCFEEPIQDILKETVERQTKTNILKKPTQKSILKDPNGIEQNVIYVQTIPEKENMEFMGVERQPKPNSRSLLICNQPGQSKKKISDPLYIKNKNLKRFSRTKEAKEARQFINFINATTIPQVPERKERLPRKQQIKPVQHPNEDIVVKEMIVSSNGFMEPISAEEKKNLPVTEYVELLDSGDECNSEEKNSRKNKQTCEQEPIEIEISDSEESNLSVIEYNPSNTNEEVQTESKQKRGRTLVNERPENDKRDPDSSSESPPKMSRTENDMEVVTSNFQIISMATNINSEIDQNHLNNTDTTSDAIASEIESGRLQVATGEVKTNKTEDCSKVKVGVLRKQSGKPDNVNTERSASKLLGNKKLVQSKETQPKNKIEYKYECGKCKSRFINEFLLNRHNCTVKSGLAFTCNTCSRKFPNSTSLNVHMKVHFKQPQLPNINSKNKKVEVSKLPARNSVMSSKTSEMSLGSAGGATRRDLGKQGAIPRRSLKPPAADQNVGKGTPNKNLLKLDKQCEKCPMRFDTHAAWFDHQVLIHNLKTPDKSIGEKRKKASINIVAHTGIPARSEVARNFMIIGNRIRAQQEESCNNVQQCK